MSKPVTAQTRKQMWLHAITRIVSLVISLGVLAYIINQVSTRDLAALKIENAGFLVTAILIAPVILLCKVTKWWLLLNALPTPVAWGVAIKSLLGGMAVALLTPARLGELARVAYLPPATRGQSVGILAIDRLTDIMVLAVFAVCAALFTAQSPHLLTIGIGLVIACVGGLLVMRVYARQLIPLAGKIRVLAGIITSILSGLLCVPQRRILLGLALGAFSSSLGIAQFALILLSLSDPLRADIALAQVSAASFPLIVLTNLIPLSISGLGIREGAAVWLTQAYGVPTLVAASAAFLSFALNTLAPGLLGALIGITPQIRSRNTP